ncbi:teichoic acid biosynthesis protein C [Actinomadura alba]|uniref:Teichoic acid biosynthesis protein C n=1 Tax=Actinomadura alba TaxID=406431 RepID=A0ABR7LYB0_9ACTN|nr:teichoic acid biosynthesis protein C [Actinomadura alba]MBC6469378.1 teichoic acid biosynthesis protein C [Actinomadura alba]
MSDALSRRRLLQGGGGVAAALALEVAGANNARAAIRRSRRFQLTAASNALLKERALTGARVLQSFGFDDVDRHIYTVQLRSGSPARNGDLCVTRLDPTGRRVGCMNLRGFGHGEQIGVESAGRGAAPYLWTEYRSSDGWGTRIARFRFVNGATIGSGHSGITDRTPRIAGLGSPRPAIDPWHDRLVVRYRKDGRLRAAVFDLDQAVRGRTDGRHRLADVRLPDPDPAAQPAQGFALFGQYMYLFHGTPYGHAGSKAPVGNARITCVDLNSGRVVERELTRAFQGLTYREPEGMAIQVISPSGRSPQARLCFGFASGPVGARRASIAYKPMPS